MTNPGRGSGEVRLSLRSWPSRRGGSRWMLTTAGLRRHPADLPIALGLMAAIGAIPPDALDGFTVLGELGLDGSIAPVAGVLPAAIGANSRDEGLICPAACGSEAAWASPDIQIIAPPAR